MATCFCWLPAELLVAALVGVLEALAMVRLWAVLAEVTSAGEAAGRTGEVLLLVLALAGAGAGAAGLGDAACFCFCCLGDSLAAAAEGAGAGAGARTGAGMLKPPLTATRRSSSSSGRTATAPAPAPAAASTPAEPPCCHCSSRAPTASRMLRRGSSATKSTQSSRQNDANA